MDIHTFNSFVKLNVDKNVFNKNTRKLIQSSNRQGQNLMNCKIVESYNEYLEYKAENSFHWNARLRLEEHLAKINPKNFTVHGIDPVSFSPAEYNVGGKRNRKRNGIDIPNYREGLRDLSTDLNSRLRAVALCLNSFELLNPKNVDSVYLTEETTPFYNYIEKILSQKKIKLSGSEYLGPQYESGDIVDGLNHEDLTKLSLKSKSKDLVICLEVLEHIPEYKKALAELSRIISDDGHCIITVPFTFNKIEHTERALLEEDGKINHILEPEYHGDPVNPNGGVLCYRYYGWKLFDELKELGFKEVKMFFAWSMVYGIIGGTEIGIIYAKR